MNIVYFFFYSLALVQILLAYKSYREGIRYLRFFKERLKKGAPDYAPKACIFLPCKGLEAGLKKNLWAIMKQDYPDFRVIFVVEDFGDGAVEIIQEIVAGDSRAELLIAGQATNCGQKVHNLIRATEFISDDIEVLVFADSDARPDPNWIQNLVAPLDKNWIGCTTGYRWFIPEGGIASELRSVWNASIASSLNEDSRFCWGGATAIKKDTFEELGIRNRWNQTLSDDFVLANAVREANRKIFFVPQCLTPSYGDCSFRELLEFTTRQMKITRVYSSTLWKLSFLSSTIFIAAFWGGILLLPFATSLHKVFVFAILQIIFAFGVAKADLRFRAGRLILAPHFPKNNRFWQDFLWIFTPFIFFLNNFSALFSRNIIWRGKAYELKSDIRTEIVEN